MGAIHVAFLAFLVPEMSKWAERPTGFGTANHGFPGWVLCEGVGVGDAGLGVQLARGESESVTKRNRLKW